MKWSGRRNISRDESTYELVNLYGKDIIENLTYKSQVKFKQHRASNTLRHCMGVALACVRMSRRWHIKVDVKSLVRGALLHDFYLYQYTECHKKGHFHHHGEWAAINAEHYFGINELERNMICCHMWPIRILAIPRSRECLILTIQDKLVGIREFLGMKVIYN